MTRKLAVLAATVMTTFLLARPANADTVTFDPTGTAGPAGNITIDRLDWAPGNTLAVATTSLAGGLVIGSQVQVYYQASLAAAQCCSVPGPELNVFSNGTGGNYFTVAVQLTETVQFAAPGIAIFGQPGSGVFKVYWHNTAANDFAGTCFVSDCGGIEVLSGNILNNGNFSGSFIVNNQDPAIVPLDAFGNNDWPAVSSIKGGGPTTFDAQITSVNSLFFPNINLSGIISLLLNTSDQVLNFRNADPATCLSNNAVTACNIFGAGTVGATNGLSNNRIMLESDARSSFESIQEIPEPATLSLLGLGLLGSAAARRRQLKNKKS